MGTKRLSVIEQIKARHKKINDALKENYSRRDVTVYNHLVEYLNFCFMHISCDHETEITKFIEKIPFRKK